MPRLLSYVVLLALLVFGAVWLADRPGAVSVDWLGWRVETSVPVLLIGLFVLAGLLVLVIRLVLGVWRLPGRLLFGHRQSRRRKGYQALTDGLAAAAGGEVSRARKLSGRAQKLLADPALTSFLAAQTAQLAGDSGTAKGHYTQMLERPETASLGLRGLLDQALERGDEASAIELSQRARLINPADSWLVGTLFKLLVKTDRLREAQELVADAAKRRALSPLEAARWRALVLNERSARAAAEGDGRTAITYAKQAAAADPGLAAATLRLAVALTEGGKQRRAAALLEKAWSRRPALELVRAYGELRPGEEPLQRLRRIEKLVAGQPNASESHLAIAEAALAAKLWGLARTHLLAAADLRPSVGPYRLLARLERAEYKNEEAARAWERKAAEAPADPAWICATCGSATTDWSLACPNCGSIDSLAWGTPKVTVVPVASVG